MLTNCFLDVSIQHRAFNTVLKREMRRQQFLQFSFNGLEALRMAASLDKLMILRKFRQVQKKNSNPDAAGAVMLLFFCCCCFVHAIIKQTKKKRKKKYLEPTRFEEVTGVLFLATANNSSSKFLLLNRKTSSSLHCCIYIKQQIPSLVRVQST